MEIGVGMMKKMRDEIKKLREEMREKERRKRKKVNGEDRGFGSKTG